VAYFFCIAIWTETVWLERATGDSMDIDWFYVVVAGLFWQQNGIGADFKQELGFVNY
jgi:hypothetical protein